MCRGRWVSKKLINKNNIIITIINVRKSDVYFIVVINANYWASRYAYDDGARIRLQQNERRRTDGSGRGHGLKSAVLKGGAEAVRRRIGPGTRW